MDKEALKTQLAANLRAVARGAQEAYLAASNEAKTGATPQEKKEDARVALEYSSLSKGQSMRAKRAYAELAALENFRPGTIQATGRVQVGSIVEIEDCDTGEGKTFFMAPVGAGVTLTGPDDDGYLSVVTPQSPIGKAVMGQRVNAIVDVQVKRAPREWKITWVE